MQETTEDHAFKLKLNYWEQLRNVIIHEDTLVNSRSAALITFEGFLIAGFFALYTHDVHALLNESTILVLLFIFILASWLCIATGLLMLTAYRQISCIRHAWYRKYPTETHDTQCSTTPILAEFPPIIGEPPTLQLIMRFFFKECRGSRFTLVITPLVLFLVNFLMMIIILLTFFGLIAAPNA